MQININVNLSKDVLDLCHYTEEKPEDVVQSFLDEVSYPLFFTTRDRLKKFATYFFIKHLQSPKFKGKINDSLEEHYFGQLKDAVNGSYETHPNDQEKAMAAARVVMDQWARGAIAERSRYLTDDL